MEPAQILLVLFYLWLAVAAVVWAWGACRGFVQRGRAPAPGDGPPDPPM